MTNHSRAEREMIDVITSVDDEWPLALLYRTDKGANIKRRAGSNLPICGLEQQDPIW